MKWPAIAVSCAVAAGSVIGVTLSHGAPATAVVTPTTATSPIYGVSLPDGYRQWQLVGVAQETGALDELRAVVGNAAALLAYRSAALPFPDGTVLVKLAWEREQSAEFAPAFVPGKPTTVQVMVKDSKRYAATGGWGFGRFVDGKSADEAQHRTCFACHNTNVRDHDFVFTRYAR
ncbi:Cytochrome P460 [Enhydrobacter aerosaccus]|uniref:Cytochrome P460 n=1 Tax=Enhydrobacter aerosaccus TaxID=225324 RepID=A0A1T4KR20_9HYPH|nr:cytochrome P460 family protein [Enhydrobacter aerosaccus]SJZ44852.1 Cytochrome P460 [Enhydrobacter aerosaccus]